MLFIYLFTALVGGSLSPPQVSIHIDANAYSKTAARWSEMLMKTTTEHSSTFIKKMHIEDSKHANLSRDYIIWIPAGDPHNKNRSEKTIGVLWFHGHHGFSSRTFRERILKQFRRQPDKNFFVVIPEMPWSVNTSTRNSRNGQIWRRSGDFTKFIKQVRRDVALAGISEIDWRVVGHSAGGSTIATIGSTGDLCLLNPSMIVWSDSTYGWWIQKANRSCLQEFKTEVFINGHPSTATSARRILTTEAGRNVTVHRKELTHKQIGDNIVKLSGVLND